MEVHHHSHTSRKKWTHYFWEFLMLFLAVFAGFLAENQREHIVEKHRAKDYARGLLRDLGTDTTNMNNWSVYYKKFVATMDSLISMAINNKISPSNSGRFAWYCRHSLWHVPIPWQRTTMEQIINSGNIRYFKDYKLQEMIAGYNSAIENNIQTFILENPSSDRARDMTNRLLDIKTNYEYSKVSLMIAVTMTPASIDSLVDRFVSFENKQDLKDELVNMAIYRRRSYLPLIDGMPGLKKMATDLILELKRQYHL